MEGRVYSDLYRNTSEELFIKNLMEASVGMPAPTMEMLGFKNLSQNCRTDSEELFKSWLTYGENPGHNSANAVHPLPQQASRRLATELAGLSGHLNGVLLHQKKASENLLSSNSLPIDESSNGLSEHSIRNPVDKELQASNLFLSKAWFHSSQPMTRSHSAELRRRYAAMQNSQTSIGMEAMNNAPGHTPNNLKQGYTNPNGFIEAAGCDIPNQFNKFMSASNSSFSTFNTPLVGASDNISSVVSMLKGTLELKKLSKQYEKEPTEDSPVLGYYGGQETLDYSTLYHKQGTNHITEVMQESFQDRLNVQVNDRRLGRRIGLESFMAPPNPIHMNTLSREPSQSESSAAAPVVSACFDVCDGPSISDQTLTVCESSRKPVGETKSSENVPEAKDIREQIFHNLKQERKQKGSVVRYGSIASVGSGDKGDPTKKRRVERSRKMAEAKERTLSPSVPSDMQSILKRCETLEKEMRSLKLNLAFMNRKDSEQTKQIEELQKQNDELGEEKERLLEEIERIVSATGKM